MRKLLLYILAFGVASTCCGLIYAHINDHTDTLDTSIILPADTLPHNDSITLPDTLVIIDTIREVTIACVGDMVLGINYPSNAQRLPIHDGAHLFDQVLPYLKNAD